MTGSKVPVADGMALLDAVDLAVVATDNDMVVTYWNTAAAALFGWSADHAIHRGLPELLGTAESDVTAAALAMVTRGESWSGNLSVRRSDDASLVVRSTCNPLLDGTGAIVGNIALLSEVVGGDRQPGSQPALVAISDGPVATAAPPAANGIHLHHTSAARADHDSISVLLATDSLLIGDGMASLLTEVDGIEVAGRVRDHFELIRLTTELHPQAVIISIRSTSPASTATVVAARHLRSEFPELGLVLISDCGNGFALELLRDGASRIAYLLDEQLPTMESVVDAVREVTAGQSVLDPSIVDFLVSNRRSTGVDDLTHRETDVLELMSEGLSNRAIADSLHISVKSIEKCVTAIFRNLDVADLSGVDRRVTATLSYQRARTTGLEAELRRIRKTSTADPSPMVVAPRKGDALARLSTRGTLGA
jgi:PAS domain S-box-containing protein